jgi:hypothetical protein
MRRHQFSFEIAAPRDVVWSILHPPPPTPPPVEHRVIEYRGVRIEIINEGDANGQGLVRRCTFPVPKILLSGGIGRSWECVTESHPPEYSRYEAVGKPLWSEATGWHRLHDRGNETTLVEFGETYHAFNPVSRLLLERYVHRFISKDDDTIIRNAIERGVERWRERDHDADAR